MSLQKALQTLRFVHDQVFENNIEIMIMGTQYKALHVGYILDHIHQSVNSEISIRLSLSQNRSTKVSFEFKLITLRKSKK